MDDYVTYPLCMNRSGKFFCRRPKGHEGDCGDSGSTWLARWPAVTEPEGETN